MLSMNISVGKCLFMLIVCVLAESATSFRLDSSSPPVCELEFEFEAFLRNLNSQCPSSNRFYSSPIQFFDGYGYHGTSFEQTYRCYPASFIDKAQIENGDKVIMPPSALDRLGKSRI